MNNKIVRPWLRKELIILFWIQRWVNPDKVPNPLKFLTSFLNHISISKGKSLFHCFFYIWWKWTTCLFQIVIEKFQCLFADWIVNELISWLFDRRITGLWSPHLWIKIYGYAPQSWTVSFWYFNCRGDSTVSIPRSNFGDLFNSSVDSLNTYKV